MPDTRFITEFDQYLFGQGTHYDLYNKLGAHPMTVDGEEGVYFAVWAPNAEAVSLVGNFNEWDENATPMERLEPLGIYEIFLPEMKIGDIYKYCVTTKAGYTILKDASSPQEAILPFSSAYSYIQINPFLLPLFIYILPCCLLLLYNHLSCLCSFCSCYFTRFTDTVSPPTEMLAFNFRIIA